MVFRSFLKGAFGLAVLCATLFVVDRQVLLNAFKQISLTDLGILVVISYLLLVISVIKWQSFLNHLGVLTSFWRLMRLYLIGYFVNLIFPSYVGGDVVRSIAAGKDQDKSSAISATILERYTGLVAMIFLGLIALPFAPATPIGIKGAMVVTVFLVAAISFAVISGVASRVMNSPRISSYSILKRIKVAINKVEAGLKSGVSNRNLLIRVGVLSLLFHGLAIVNTMAVAHAIGWYTAEWSSLFVVVPLVLLVGAIPVSPQGLGIQEGAFVFFLTRVGATPEQALGIGLVLRAKAYILALIGGVVWMLGKGRQKTASENRGENVPREKLEP